jgi:arsenate reductase-like glutaredoxin family protein
MSLPSPTNAPGYFQRYIDQVTETELSAALNNQIAGIQAFLNSITEEKSNYAYAADKWTIKELLQHIIDTERIFSYRALCIARGEKITLPGFDENEYAANSNANERRWESLVFEMLVVRESTKILFSSFTPEALETIGTAGSNSLSVSQIGFILVGHFNHHKKVLQERYL